jgi:hypothetical protein
MTHKALAARGGHHGFGSNRMLWWGFSFIIGCCAAETVSWSERPTTGIAPPARSLFQGNVDSLLNTYTIVGGGSGVVGSGNELNDIWTYDLTSGKWSVAFTVGVPNSPTNRIGTLAGTLQQIGNKYYLYGGADSNMIQKAMFEYDPKLFSWTEMIMIVGDTASVPVPRRQHQSFVRNDRMYIVGGQGATDMLNEMWSWAPGTSWIKVNVTGSQRLPPMVQFQLVYDSANDVAYAFAGRYQATNTIENPNEMFWRFTFSNMQWTKMPLASPTPTLVDSCSWIFQNQLYTWGGSLLPFTISVNYIQRLNLSTGAPFKWEQTIFSGTAPGPRGAQHCAVLPLCLAVSLFRFLVLNMFLVQPSASACLNVSIMRFCTLLFRWS